MEADLKSKLAAHGVEMPERPGHYNALGNAEYIDSLLTALSRVVGMLEAALKCDVCNGDGKFDPPFDDLTCSTCYGTGKRGEGA